MIQGCRMAHQGQSWMLLITAANGKISFWSISQRWINTQPKQTHHSTLHSLLRTSCLGSTSHGHEECWKSGILWSTMKIEDFWVPRGGERTVSMYSRVCLNWNTCMCKFREKLDHLGKHSGHLVFKLVNIF